NAATYVTAPSTTLGSMDFYPRPGQCQGTPVDLSSFSTEVDHAVDFNGSSKGTFTFRGAYAGQGSNPGWALDAGLKGGGPSGAGGGGGGWGGGAGGAGGRTGSGSRSGASSGGGGHGGGCHASIAAEQPPLTGLWLGLSILLVLRFPRRRI